MVMNWNEANVLVTGGTGFVGSHLVEELLNRGAAHVVTTFQTDEPRGYFARCGLTARVTQVRADVSDAEAVFDVVSRHRISTVFHLAAQPIVEVALDNPLRTYASNVMGTVSIMECARRLTSVKAVVVASSDKAYGKISSGKYLEDNPLRGDHPYEASKAAADLVAQSYFKTYGVPVAVTRFGNIYGAGDINFSRLIPGLMQCLLRGETLQLRSDGRHVRDFLNVKDVVRGYLLLAERMTEFKGEAFNFGSTDTHTVLDVIRIAEEALGRKIPHKILNTARNEIPYQSLDFSKAGRLLGWKPECTLAGTLPGIYDWYKALLSGEGS